MFLIITESFNLAISLDGPLCILEFIGSNSTIPRSIEHSCYGWSTITHAMLVLLLSQSRVECNLSCKNEVCMLLQTEVSVYFHHDAFFFEVMRVHWLALVEYVVLVLSIESSEVPLELNIEVFLHRVQE